MVTSKGVYMIQESNTLKIQVRAATCRSRTHSDRSCKASSEQSNARAHINIPHLTHRRTPVILSYKDCDLFAKNILISSSKVRMRFTVSTGHARPNCDFPYVPNKGKRLEQQALSAKPTG